MDKLAGRPTLWRTVAAFTCYGFYSAGLFLLLLIFTPILMVISFNSRLRDFVFQKMFKNFLCFLTRFYLPLMQIYRIVEEPDYPNLQKSSPVIYVANHRSRIDGLMLLAVLEKTGVIMKSSYASMPVYSALVKYMNFISVNPDSVTTLASAMKKCRELLSSGMNLLIFPEGTRSRSARLLPFKDLAFRLALDTRSPVVPLIVHTDHPLMAKIPGSIVPPFRMNMKIRALPQMHSHQGERSIDFAERVRKLMAEELRKLDNGTIWEQLKSKP